MPAPFNEVHSVKKQRLLTRKRDVAGNEYIYLTGLAGTVAGSFVLYDELGITALLDSDAAATSSGGGFVAVAQAATVASTFGWYMIFGSCSAVAATVADNGEVFAATAAGGGDDTGTGGMQVIGAKWRSADSGGFATVQLSYPWVGTDVA